MPAPPSSEPTVTSFGDPASAATVGTAPGIELRGRTPRVVSTAQGWLAVLLGLPFVALGGATIAVAAGRLGGAAMRVPLFAVGALGACFAIVGLSFVGYGVAGIARRRGLAARRARYPEQPWMVDHPWDRRGGRDESPAEAGRAFRMVVFLALFLTPFHWVAFFSDERPFLFQFVTLVFDAVALALLGRSLYLIARRLRHGESRLAVVRFPIRPGTDAELRLDGISPLARAVPMRATLRCIEERFEVRGSGRNRSTVSVCYELHRDEQVVAPGESHVRFEILDGAATTMLGARPPRYWELELAAETPGVDFGARFLVPVY